MANRNQMSIQFEEGINYCLELQVDDVLFFVPKCQFLFKMFSKLNSILFKDNQILQLICKLIYDLAKLRNFHDNVLDQYY